MAGTDEKNVEKLLTAFRRAKAAMALDEMHLASLKAGTQKMTEAEIDAEIKAVRKERKQ